MNVAANPKSSKKALSSESIYALLLGSFFFTLVGISVYSSLFAAFQTLFLLLGAVCFLFVCFKLWPANESIEKLPLAVLVTAYLFMITESLRVHSPDTALNIWDIQSDRVTGGIVWGFECDSPSLQISQVSGTIFFLLLCGICITASKSKLGFIYDFVHYCSVSIYLGKAYSPETFALSGGGICIDAVLVCPIHSNR